MRKIALATIHVPAKFKPFNDRVNKGNQDVDAAALAESQPAPAKQQSNTEPPVCEKHAEKMILCFYDRPGSPPGNGWSCQSCAKERMAAPAKEDK